VDAFEKLANLATAAAVEGRRHIRIRAPLLHLTKREIIQLGTRLGVDYAMTTSCYDPSHLGEACGHCDACQLRLRGFAEGGAADPAPYQHDSLEP
jgi:7-cyano-7-deazaguanine synthase